VANDALAGATVGHPLLTMNRTAMGSRIQIQVVGAAGPTSTLRETIEAAFEVFTDVDRACTRFHDSSPLMVANAEPDQWCAVGPTCYLALTAAYSAYLRTGGRFDPRVHGDLIRLGYDRSLTDNHPSERPREALSPRPARKTWEAAFRPAEFSVRLGPDPVDLGGIGKGLAVRWAAEVLDAAGVSYLIDAGGDCFARGTCEDGGAWRIGVEQPTGQDGPAAVLAVSDCAIATSSVRVGQWTIAETPVHHLIDPVNGCPGGAGIHAVTVVGADTADAEVWSKTLFLEGIENIERRATALGLDALWIGIDGTLATTPSMDAHVIWQAA
jgi:FAD:protein FMN transferase